jgi:hypothetical protein
VKPACHAPLALLVTSILWQPSQDIPNGFLGFSEPILFMHAFVTGNKIRHTYKRSWQEKVTNNLKISLNTYCIVHNRHQNLYRRTYWTRQTWHTNKIVYQHLSTHRSCLPSNSSPKILFSGYLVTTCHPRVIVKTSFGMCSNDLSL